MRNTQRMIAVAVSAAVGVATLTSFAPNAQADEVSPKGKGIVGGVLLGAEVVTITESLIGVKSGWAYAVGGGLGAIGGGIGGYFVEQGSTDGRIPVYMLAGGLALIIPAVVLTLNATRYQASEDATEDHPPTNAPAANPGRPGGSVITGPNSDAPPATTPVTSPPPAAGGSGSPTPTTSTPGSGGPPVPAPTSLLDVNGGALRVGIVLPEVRPMYSLREQKQFGLPQRTELRLPVFSVAF